MSVSSHFAAVGLALTLAVTTTPLGAQEADQSFIYASYYQCDPGSVGDAVQNVRENWSPVVQDHMDAGHVTAWGALTHSTGNEWSLVLYHVGTDLDEIGAAIQSAVSRYNSENPEASAQFSDACSSHEDYVWVSDMSSGPPAEQGADRAEAAMSVYWVCDEGREAVADLIFESVMAEALNEQVEAGLMNGWSWNEHYLGGKYRRLLATDGPDHASLLEARNNMIEAMGENPGLAAAFSEVCNGHQDNLYDIEISEP